MSAALTRAHITAQERVRAAVANAVGRTWTALPAYDEDDADAFITAALPLVTAGQLQSVRLTDAYLARMLRRQPIGLDAADVTGPAVRGGTDMRTVYRRPFIQLWSALSDGTDYQAAVGMGLTRAVMTARTDVQLTHRAALQAAQDRDPAIRGFQRVADSGACAYCQMIDGAFVKSADAMPLHPGCGCGLEPRTEPVDTPVLPDAVAVHEHGELGPVVGDAAHDFTAQSDL